MTIRHTPSLLIPIAITALLAILLLIFGGASSQEINGDDYGIWYVQGTAQYRGGFLQPNELAVGTLNQPLDRSSFTPDRDGFLLYLGQDDDLSIDRSYTVAIDARFHDPIITVSTFYDSLYITSYADNYGFSANAFAARIGLESAQSSVQVVPVGHRVARNVPGVPYVSFTPVPGDIGAYLILVASYDPNAHGEYFLTITPDS